MKKKSIVSCFKQRKQMEHLHFNDFLNKWSINYIIYKKRSFIFIFDTSNVGYIPIKYSIKIIYL